MCGKLLRPASSRARDSMRMPALLLSGDRPSGRRYIRLKRCPDGTSLRPRDPISLAFRVDFRELSLRLRRPRTAWSSRDTHILVSLLKLIEEAIGGTLIDGPRPPLQRGFWFGAKCGGLAAHRAPGDREEPRAETETLLPRRSILLPDFMVGPRVQSRRKRHKIHHIYPSQV